MKQATLFICEGCTFNSEESKPEDITGGKYLLNQLQELWGDWSRQEELIIKPVGCLCICDRACACAISATHKPTFLFGDIPPENRASAILEMSELYLDSENGYVPLYKLPKVLQPARLARIPPLQ